MISRGTTFYYGWTREYWGYLMAGHYKHTAQEDYHCVDEDPESLPGDMSIIMGIYCTFSV